jgi:hypothetical protein
MSYARRQRASARSRRRWAIPRWLAPLAALASCTSACARFGFERLDPDHDAGQGGSFGWGGTDAAIPVGGGPPVPGPRDAGGRPGPGEPPDAAGGGCFDGARNGAEVGVDCGGDCSPCVCSLGAPERLGDPNYPGNDLWSPRLSSDGLSLYFGLITSGLGEQVAVATRPDLTAPFGLGEPLPAPVNQGKDGTPFLTSNGLSLYFYSERAGDAGGRDLYVATRGRLADSFDDVTPLSSLNTPEFEYLPWLGSDELTIYFASGPANGRDIFRSTRASVGAAFPAAQAVTELNTPSDEEGITLSSDSLEVIFASNRPGGVGGRDLYRATRARATEPFASPEPLLGLNTTDNELDPAFSPDAGWLYFVSNRASGDSSVYRAARDCTR